FSIYRVNVIVDNSDLSSPPVIHETNPNYNNLFGRIEKRPLFGTFITDFNMIRAGSMIRANGGFLIVNALDVLLNPGVWPALKRSIRNQEVRIEELAEQYGFAWTGGIKPEPVPTNVKVIMVGSPHIYHLLYALDEDFRKVFKVKVDFDHNMERSPENIEAYASFIAYRCREEGLLPFDREAVARVLQHGVRLAGDKKKLTSRFSEVVDTIREASFWARKEGSPVVRAQDVQKAIDEKDFRSNLLEEKIQELIGEGTLMVDLEGAVVGQVNGLSVYNVGDFTFGKPSRITARTFMGEEGVINIERESKLSGRIHDKGVLILSGYLGGKYARNRPLPLSASICFEQSYEGVEGDSASTAELYALISCLSDLPVKQGIAVTGSVNQRGEIQPIGGVNEKIEGFFDVCNARGLTGDQGVIIPHQNVKNLMLKQKIIDAVAQGRFHIYPIHNIDEGLKILTGVEAGELLPDGTYPPESVHGRADARLNELYQEMRRGRRRADREEEEEEEEAPEPA
ncbi:MAG: Lon protease family protein, partial [Nitrospinota bacterium]